MLGLLAAPGVLSWGVLGMYTLLSAVTFFAYWQDKLAAQRGTRRTGEGTLILLGLLGGWPGALVAQTMLRHKTRKQPFRTVFWVSVIANIALVGWLSISLRFGAGS